MVDATTAVLLTTGMAAFLLIFIVDLTHGLDQIGRDLYHTVISIEWRPSDDEQGDEDPWWRCPRCGARCHEGAKDDHLESHRETEETEDDEEMAGRDHGVSRGDLVDDYELDRPEDEEDEGLELQEASGGESVGERARRHPVYQWVTERIEEWDEAVVLSHTHVGSVRGGDVVQLFRQLVRRVPDDSLEDYEFDGWGTGDYPVRVRKA